MWCQLCGDRIIEKTVTMNGKKIDVCKSCSSMVSDEGKEGEE